MLLTKLAAVWKAREGGTDSTDDGFSGSHPCRRCKPYRPSTETRLKAMTERAYTVQGCSRSGSIRPTR